jgi:hypothetical protein
VALREGRAADSSGGRLQAPRQAAEPKLDDREQTEVEKTLFELEFDLDPELVPNEGGAVKAA